MKFDKTHAALFDKVEFLIEANHNEYFSLWQNFASESEHRLYPNTSVIWSLDNPGKHIEIGEVDGRPTCVSIIYAILNGKRVAFYEGCSQLVDYSMIDQWLWHFAEHTEKCNAENFHHCLDKIGALK